MKTKPLNTALIVAGVLAVGTAGAFSLKPAWLDKAKAEMLPAQPVATQSSGDVQVAALSATAAPAPVPMIAGNGQVPNYRAIVEQFGPAVVGITVAGTQKPEGAQQGRGLPPGMEDDPFFQFFKGIPGFGQGGPRGGQGGVPQQPFRGQGSGFIISADGLILTNAHVVRDAKEVMVKLSDRSEYSAKVLGSDPVTDVAVLRIDAKGLPVVRLGDPKQLGVGDPVLAIGAPFGFEQSATQGIVSAKGRSLPGDAVVPFIQTDAAVNPGNSGGPLFSGNGEVIGINAQIYSRTGGYQGLAFAIPIDVALKVKDQIVATGKASHGRLGVTVQDLNQHAGRVLRPEAPRRRAGVAGGAGQRRCRGRPEGGRCHHPRQRRDAGALGLAVQRDRHVRAGREGPLERVARPEGPRHRGQAGRRDAGRRSGGRCRRCRAGPAPGPVAARAAAAGEEPSQARRRPGGRTGHGCGRTRRHRSR